MTTISHQILSIELAKAVVVIGFIFSLGFALSNAWSLVTSIADDVRILKEITQPLSTMESDIDYMKRDIQELQSDQ